MFLVHDFSDFQTANPVMVHLKKQYTYVFHILYNHHAYLK